MFKEQFGVLTANEGWQLKSSDKSLWVSIIQVGEVVGSLLAGPIGYVELVSPCGPQTDKQ